MDQVGKVKNHVILDSNYQKYYLENLPTPYSISGVTTNKTCMRCNSSENVKYDLKYHVTVCVNCSSSPDILISLDDIKHDMFDLTEWLPILRDSQHNLLYQHVTSGKIATSSTNSSGQISYRSYPSNVKLIPTLNLLNDLAINYSKNWDVNTFYNLPIRTFMYGSMHPEPLQPIIIPGEGNVDNEGDEGNVDNEGDEGNVDNEGDEGNVDNEGDELNQIKDLKISNK